MRKENFIVKRLEQLISSKSIAFLSREEIIKKANKFFSTSGFATKNKNETIRIDQKGRILFGLEEGFIFTDSGFYFLTILGSTNVFKFNFDKFLLLQANHHSLTEVGKLVINGEFIVNENRLVPFKLDVYDKIKKSIEKAHYEYGEYVANQKLEEKMKEIKRLDNLKKNQEIHLKDLDSDKDGNVDLIENDFNKLLSKNQKIIISIDKNYIHQFVRISNFIKTKKENTQRIFESIRETSSQEELNERVSLLNNQIHSYELLVFHSINMVGALVSEDLISFYEIYESFDKLNIFNSNWENEVSEKLRNIGDKLSGLMYAIYNMEQNIVNELNNLSYVTQESFEDLNRSVTSQLKDVQSSINTNNLLTGIQAYQLYKINNNTKGLR
jgi:hypothetical protein